MRARGRARGAGFAGGRSYHHAHGVFVGVDQVSGATEPRASDIGAENDVRLLAEALSTALHTSTSLVGKQATRRTVLARLEDVMQAAAPGDLVIAYFAAETMQRQYELYLLPNDYEPHAFYATTVSFRLVSSVLGSVPGVKSLLILDACHAGGVGFDMSRYRAGSESCLMVSSGPDEYAAVAIMEAQGRHGLFTWALVQAAREWQDREGAGWTMALIDWFDRAYTLTLEYSDDRRSARQHPVLLGTLSPNLVIRARRATDLGDPSGDGMARWREAAAGDAR